LTYLSEEITFDLHKTLMLSQKDKIFFENNLSHEYRSIISLIFYRMVNMQ